MTDPADEMRQFTRALFNESHDDPAESHEPPAAQPNYASREGHTPKAPRTNDHDLREFTRALFTTND